MIELPEIGSRVSLRYRLPTDAERPMTDVVGHIVDAGAVVRIRTRHGDVVDVDRGDVLAVRVVPEMPVRTGEIRNLEHAAALGWPGVDHEWHHGWLLRSGRGATRRANSAVPLQYSSFAEITEAIDWYARRDLPALISAPDRLFRIPQGVPTDAENVFMATDVAPSRTVPVSPTPEDSWLRVYQRDVPVDVLTAVIDGEVGFGELDGAAVGRVAVTEAPDGTRWAGLSAVRVDESARRRGLARTLCEGMLTWAHERGATRAYVQVVTENTAARTLYESMGFVVHHRSRYVRAQDLL
ncbi:N-acetylglutamate synthase, CG3035 family [Mycolicibacterium gilvum]|uniref:Acetyltransferase (GNAT) family protein n=1 Tax=Mycolicibacterium gilvum (strain DSM 45189 / LMG 24558 / Spyr1) TaxID=278137 RepID=E6TA37_MYCSR|nr:GNAT family N-acetyltransferase [Mycolicibacterium gilvum]ADT97309.1 acetyltransferase (GNAT) family protein [Mycolicibacterium gilvum Spyr1]